MLAKIELWLNIIHYCIYKLDYRLHLLSNKINPFLLLGKIPAVEKNFREQGTSLKEFGNKFWTDRRFGFGVIISGGVLVIIVFLMIFSAILIINGVFNNPNNLSWRHLLIICTLLSYLICHILVFKKDNYLAYFRKFDKWSKREKWKYGLIAFVFVTVALALWIFSFRFIPVP